MPFPAALCEGLPVTTSTPERPSVLDLLHTVVDDGSFLSWDEPLVEVATDEAYAQRWPGLGSAPAWTSRC